MANLAGFGGGKTYDGGGEIYHPLCGIAVLRDFTTPDLRPENIERTKKLLDATPGVTVMVIRDATITWEKPRRAGVSDEDWNLTVAARQRARDSGDVALVDWLKKQPEAMFLCRYKNFYHGEDDQAMRELWAWIPPRVRKLVTRGQVDKSFLAAYPKEVPK